MLQIRTPILALLNPYATLATGKVCTPAEHACTNTTASRQMICTNTPEASPAVGCILEQEQMAWDRADWIDALQELSGETYASSVIWASDAESLLGLPDLRKLLRDHGTSTDQLMADLDAAKAAGHPVAHPCHAGQALVWLGY